MDRTTQILKNSATLNALQGRIHDSFKLKDKSPEGRQRWETACRTFHESFDALFFPGGSSTLARVRSGDPVAVGAAIDFLVADPTHFRPGYVKEELWHNAPRWSLSAEARGRMESAALAYLDKQIRREFWYMCRAMARIGSASFWQEVSQRLDSPDALVTKRASYLFAYRSGVDAGERVHRAVSYEVLRRKYG